MSSRVCRSSDVPGWFDLPSARPAPGRHPSFPSRWLRRGLGSTLALAGLIVAAAPTGRAANALSRQSSALLQAQAASPVDWMPWGDAAFARAKTENKPVYVAVGAFTSELSRAMSRQSFSNAETAAFLNSHFVCVYVDAKEHPDVAALYQVYLQEVKQVSGPPMNVWLTPALKPFEGANYLPPTEEWGREGFITTVKRVATAWTADPAAQSRKAEEAVAAVTTAQRRPAAGAPDATAPAATLADARKTWIARLDSANGGFGDPPKYVEPELLRFLLQNPETQPAAITTLRAILHSPMHDPLDGGFFRSASDAAWRQPYFQKLLADQPRLAIALLDAAKLTGDREFADAARSALRFVLDRLALPGGEYSAAEDAASDDLTGAFFWTMDEIRTVLGAKAAGEFAQAYGVTENGNIPEDAFPGAVLKGKNILYRATPPGSPAAEKALAQSAAKLLARRSQRAKPRRDDAATAGAHGLLLTALVRAGAELNDSRLTSAAKTEAAFIRDHLVAKDGGLMHLSGSAIEATPADYALVADGLFTFHEISGDAAAGKLALGLIGVVDTRYWDSGANRFFAVPAANNGAFWVRVHSPAAGAGDPPTADPAMLAVFAGHASARKAGGDIRDKLVRTLVEDVAASADPARGDVLLALQLAQENPR